MSRYFHPTTRWNWAGTAGSPILLLDPLRTRRQRTAYFLFWGHSYELVNEAMWADLEEKIAAISADPAAESASVEALL